MEKAKQFVFTYKSAEELQHIVNILRAKGFTGSADADFYTHALCADVREHSFYNLNATCGAGWVHAGKPVYTAEDCETVLSE